MRLIVRHQTAYSYATPILAAIQTLRLTPRNYEALAVHRWTVTGDQHRRLPSFTDGYGNVTHCHSVMHPHSEATIYVEGEVETTNTFGVVRGAPEPLPPMFYLRRTPLTESDEAIESLAQEVVKERSLLKRLHALLNLVRDRLDYVVGTTEATTTAAQALAVGSGVCQDHAHLFVAAARHLGVPARYVGGYLWTGVELQDYQASHAWAEAFVPDLGWVGFDPANRICTTEAYIRTSIGLDYWSASPVRGVRRGTADETLAVRVQVEQAGPGSMISGPMNSELMTARITKGGTMTYCVGLDLKDGLVMLSDTRTNAGVDNISIFSKMYVFEVPGERVITLLAAGNLAITQSVVNLLNEGLEIDGEMETPLTVRSMFRAAQLVGEAVRRVYRTDGPALQAQKVAFEASFLLGGQIKDRTMRLFQVYSAGNFIEATPDTPFLQIGEHKYGKPILDRAARHDTDLYDGVKLALVSMDSTLRSNLTVGLPIDLLVYRRDTFKVELRRRLTEDDDYFRMIRDRWSEALREAYRAIPRPDWAVTTPEAAE